MGHGPGSAREKIIDAAVEVVVESGARHLTLEAVAAKAGVSRGGLLYHYPNKEALLQGLLDRRVQSINKSIADRRMEHQDSEKPETTAYVLSLVEEEVGMERATSVAIIASAAHDPQLLAPAREDYYRHLHHMMQDGITLERAAVITLAANGLKMMEAFNMFPFTQEERQRIVEEILSIARESGKACGKKTSSGSASRQP